MTRQELIRALNQAGIRYSALRCCLGRGGTVLDCFLTVSGTDAVPTWYALWRPALGLGFWPVLGGAPSPEQTGDKHTDLDAEESGRQALRLIEKASAVVLPPLGLKSAWSARNPEEVARLWEAALQDNSAVELVPEDVVEDGKRLSADAWMENVRVHLEFNSEEPFDQVEIALVPARAPWEVFAYWPFGGWNEVPHPDKVLAMMRHWYERHGAEVVSVAGATIEMYVPRPPRTRAAAAQLALEIMAFGEETILYYGTDDPDVAIPIVSSSRYWYFWWD
jgi:hypothetical protein